MNTIIKAQTTDFSKINELLKSEKLPELDLNDSTEYFFKAINENSEIIGAIGIEIYGNYGLLRSMVVMPNYRNKGIAKELVAKIETLAHQLKLQEIWLLTSTADKYFEKKGFIRISRIDVQEEIKQSKEFSSICPVSAIIMKKKLKN